LLGCPGNNQPATDFGTFCVNLAGTACMRAASCPAPSGSVALPQAVCTLLVQALVCTCGQQDVMAGRHVYHPDQADKCLAQVATEDCTMVQSVLSGKMPLSGACALVLSAGTQSGNSANCQNVDAGSN
jgi:hypothetical protein